MQKNYPAFLFFINCPHLRMSEQPQCLSFAGVVSSFIFNSNKIQIKSSKAACSIG
jgi:hypothetical protein